LLLKGFAKFLINQNKIKPSKLWKVLVYYLSGFLVL
jgi:hypothetical protein